MNDVPGDKTLHKMAQVTTEFREPFWTVVQGLADMGYGKYDTADAIGYDRSAFCRLVRRHGQHVNWPALSEMRSVHERAMPSDWGTSISAGRQRSGRGIVWVNLHGATVTQAECARRLGCSQSHVRRLRLRGELREVIG